MIVYCEKCESKFNLDEGLIKATGSKLRCTVCGHVFVAYPPEPALEEELTSDDLLAEDLEETVSLDSPPETEAGEGAPAEDALGADFDAVMDEAVQEAGFQDEPQAAGEEGEEAAEAVSEELDLDAVEEEKKKPSPKKKKARRSPLFTIIGIIVLLLVAAFAAQYFFPQKLGLKLPGLSKLPEFLSFKKSAEKKETEGIGIKRLVFKSSDGYFLQSEKLGQLFVIKGMIANDYPESRSFIEVRGSLLDETGIVVKRKQVYAGNTFTDEQIQKMSLEEINNGLQNRQGQGRSNVNIQPGASIPYMIILDNLPDNLSEFTVEAVGSSPAK